MHKLLSTLLFSLLISVCFAQVDSTKVPFVAYWSVGDSYNFKITKVKKSWKNEELTKKDSSQYIANFEVLDSTENSYKIKWMYTNKIVSTLSKQVNKLYDNEQSLDSILKRHEVTKIIYTTDEYGEFIGIENWQEISELMIGLFSQIKKTMKKKKSVNFKSVEKVFEPIIEIYSSKEGIEQLVLTELQFIHYPFGAEYEVDKPLEYEQVFPNMLGGEPITGKATLTVDYINFEDLFCVLHEIVKVNKEEAKALIISFLKRVLKEEEKSEDIFKDAVFDISDSNKYEYHYDPGVPHKISSKRTIQIEINDDITKTENLMFIELIYDEE